MSQEDAIKIRERRKVVSIGTHGRLRRKKHERNERITGIKE